MPENSRKVKNNRDRGKMQRISGRIDSAGPVENHVPLVDSLLIIDGTNIKKFSAATFPVVDSSKYRLPIVADGRGFVIAGWRQGQNGLTVDSYAKGWKGYSVKASKLIGPAWMVPRVTNMKRLQSGAILLAWYKELFGTTKSYPCFSYRKQNGAWVTLETEWDNASEGMPWVSADFAQDSQGTIWYFGQHDSNHNIACIKLHDTGQGVVVDSVNPDFVWNDEPVLGNEAESPYIVAERYGDDIILAYHSSDYKFFSVNPFSKGAKINVTQVSSAGVHSLLYQTPDYAERVTPFALAGDSIVYSPIDPITLAETGDLHHLKSDGSDKIIGKTIYTQFFRNSRNSYLYNFNGSIMIEPLS